MAADARYSDEPQDVPTPVNASSNAVDPRRTFPTHFDALMRMLFTQGHKPEDWRVLDASEASLDEDGQEVDFTLLQHGTDVVWRCRVLVSHGAAVRITAV